MSRSTSDWTLAPRRRETTGGSNTSSSTQRHHHRHHSQQADGIWAKQQPARGEINGRKGKEGITYKLEWRIDEVAELAAHVERSVGDGEPIDGARGEGREEESPSEVLRAGRSTVDGMYKFDLGVTTELEDSEHEDRSARRLSLFICCAALDVPLFTTDLFIGITSTSTPSGREHGSTPYLWTHAQSFAFRPNDDFVKIPLPVLSTLAADSGVKVSNAFTLCIRLDESYGSVPTFQPAGAVSVPTDLVAALGSMIDVPTGSDVRFICLEHELSNGDDRRVSTSSNGSYTSAMTSRKRVLYANSQILGGRSAYFADLFKGDFAEAKTGGSGRYKAVVVSSADFDTVYWMLRFVYTNELLFDETDDRVRDLLKRQSIDETTIYQLTTTPTASSHTHDEWGWHSSGRDDADSIDLETHSITSSVQSVPPPSSLRSPTASSVAKASSASPRSKHPPTSATSRSSSGSSYPSSRTVGKGPHPTRAIPEPDPHLHPCEPPAPACALAVYMLAHQYRLESLEGLAKKHILSHLTQSTCIPVFLASYRYPDLHERILDYIHKKWKDVKQDSEFVRCFQEVARGVWGEEGGTILADMVARLPY